MQGADIFSLCTWLLDTLNRKYFIFILKLLNARTYCDRICTCYNITIIITMCYCIVQVDRIDLELDDIIDSLDNVVGRDTKHLKQFSRRT